MRNVAKLMPSSYDHTVQEITLAPEPLASLTTDYAHAVIHLAWVVHRQTQARVLVCATVELIPTELPAPLPLAERSTAISKRYFLYAREIISSASRALKWVDDATSGHAVRPNDDGTIRDDSGAPTFVVSTFDAEPSVDSFVIPTVTVPFMAAWHSPSRVRHFMPAASPFVVNWTADEITSASSWLKTECDVDLDLFPEYAGSIHVLAPNPVFREVTVRREQKEDGGWCMNIAFVPRAGMSVRGIQLIVEEERASGVGVLGVIIVDGPLIRIDLPHVVGAVRTRVVDPLRGLLFSDGFGVFGVGFSLKTMLVTQTRTVKIDDGDTYEVPLRGGLDNVSTVPPQVPPKVAGETLHAAASRRARRARASETQMWFRERVHHAAEALRKLIANAEGRVFICDPYFGGDDVFRLVLAIADPKVEVQIMTSAMHLKRGGRAEGAHLERKLLEARANPPANEISVRVMRGKHPAIHDRFIIAGETMWSLGSSINNFGGRGTLLTRVTDPESIAEDLFRVWRESPSLSEWAIEREDV